MTKKLISVLMSTLNSEKTIDESINSILSQDYGNFEFLIVDDGSTDQTFNIIEKYAKRDKRIKIFNNSRNIGLTKSLNKLLDKAKGDVIARQDADDISFHNRFSFQLDYLNDTGLKIVTTRATIRDTYKKIPKYSHFFPNKLMMRYKNPFIHGTLMMDNSIMKTVGGYDENFYYAQDYKLYKDCYEAGYRISILNKVLYELNMENNISSKNKKEQNITLIVQEKILFHNFYFIFYTPIN